jgi:hypothetical protein
MMYPLIHNKNRFRTCLPLQERSSARQRLQYDLKRCFTPRSIYVLDGPTTSHTSGHCAPQEVLEGLLGDLQICILALVIHELE